MLKRIVALLFMIASMPVLAQHYYFPPPGITYNAVTGAISLGSINLTNDPNILSIDGNMFLSSAVDPGGGFSTFLGQGAGLGNGTSAAAKGFFACTGYNTCGGAGTGTVNPAQNIEDTAMGWSAGSMWTAGQFNSAFGTGSQRNETTGDNNTSVGADSMGLSVGDNSCSAFGVNALKNGLCTTSLGMGTGALIGQATSTPTNDVAMGSNAMGSASMLNPQQDVAVGVNAGQNIQSGNYSTLVGHNAGQAMTTAQHNTLIGGDSTTPVLQTGSDNTVVGYNTATKLTGSTNTIIGASVATTTLAGGSNNLLIGHSATVDTATATSSNEVNIEGLLFYNNNSLAAPAVTACGTSPAIDAHANNRSGMVTVGTGAAASCTITFAGTGYSTWNHCRITGQTTTAAFAYSYTKTVITVTATSLLGELIDYDCDGY